MLSYLLSLFSKLEQNGIKISLSEKLDTLKSLLYIDISNKDRFVNAIAANLAHNHLDYLKIRETITSTSRQTTEINTDIVELANRIKNDAYFRRESLKRAILENNFEELLPLLSQNGKIIDSRQVIQRLSDALFWERAETDLFNALLLALKSNRDTKKRLIRLIKAQEQTSPHPRQYVADLLQKGELASIPFSEIRDRDLTNLKRAIRIATKKITRKIYLSREVEKSKILNLHRTLRTNSVYENIPFYLKFKKQRKKRRNLIILCDMSESVRNSAFIMLTFINELSLLFKDVRTFAFINDITEITRIVKKKDIHNIITDILSGGVPNLFGNSNYSMSFHSFYNHCCGILKRDAIVIIIGDGRNNYNTPDTHYLNAIRKKVHRLYWFVPESKRLWGLGDSLLWIYQNISDKTFETCNLNQLSKAIMSIAG